MLLFRTFIIVYFICINELYGQPAYKFNLAIKNSDSQIGKLWIGEAYYLDQYRAGLFKVDSASSIEGTYNFNNKILYPTAIRIFNLNGFNQLLFLDTGYNAAEIAVKDSILQFRTNSRIEQEHRFFLQQMDINTIGEQIPMKKFQAYVKQNPQSYIALFALIDQVFNYKFSPEMRHIANNLDSTIRSTKAFSYFRAQYLDKRKFIAMNVVNEKEKPVMLNFNPDKYTLLDFWWVGCKGCYVDMKKLNQKNKSLRNQLTIISINTDNRTEFETSRERFLKQKLSFKSYWDYDETESKKNIFFYKYPTNLLIDKKGYIVATDIDIDRVEDFIKN